MANYIVFAIIIFGAVFLVVYMNHKNSSDTPNNESNNQQKYDNHNLPTEIEPISGSFKCKTCGGITIITDKTNMSFHCQYCGAELYDLRQLYESRVSDLKWKQAKQAKEAREKAYSHQREIELQIKNRYIKQLNFESRLKHIALIGIVLLGLICIIFISVSAYKLAN